MNRDQFAGQWKQIKGEAQRMWGRLTNDDLDIESNGRKLTVELAGGRAFGQFPMSFAARDDETGSTVVDGTFVSGGSWGMAPGIAFGLGGGGGGLSSV